MKRKDFLIIFISVILSIGFIFLVNPVKNQPTAQNLGKNLYDEVEELGKIRAGYFVGAPYFIVDPVTNEISGIFADVLQEVGKKLSLQIEWTEEVGFGEMVEGLESGRYDIVGSGIWINSARGKRADFSIPILFDAVGIYVRPNDQRFEQGFMAINSGEIKISTIDGEMAALIAETDFPEAPVLSLPQLTDFSQMALNVVNKKADVTFLGLGAANKFLENNPGALVNLSPEKPIRVFPTAVMIKRGEYEFKRMLDLAITEMLNNGEIEEIIQKYEEYPLSHYRVSVPFQVPSKN